MFINKQDFEAMFPEYLRTRLQGEVDYMYESFCRTEELLKSKYNVKVTKVDFAVRRSPSGELASFGIKATVEGGKLPKPETFEQYTSISPLETRAEWKESYDFVNEMITQQELGGVK